MSSGGLVHSASAPEGLELLRPNTREFMWQEYRESYPYKNAYEARQGLRRRKVPTKEFIDSNDKGMKDLKLHDLRVNHQYMLRARTAKAVEKAATAKAEAMSRTSKKVKELTPAEQIKQLCETMKALHP
eukprot:CAMPEP_0197661066 /NCGR_PEP_ID=MMETSP1338-20131121/51232_1 /TAXON_ID=43686 ORGANISM="Pelagodinium beii, Strain RCC1491" /NCGR_SAMPLE_ID=MMETSP1338 /ASSEMBLY_ACC=CAM_ASM_000754 /LENGTH=128 /DNA_ID=CAMNT_0043238549 /DNA_START=52 /DNA_END=435 /DNA_ORIENTATION=+